MEAIKNFQGWSDDRAIARFSKINIETMTKELAGYICWEFNERQLKMMYCTTDTNGNIVTPFVNTQAEVMNDSAKYLVQILENEIKAINDKGAKSSAGRMDEIIKMRENRENDKGNEINR